MCTPNAVDRLRVQVCLITGRRYYTTWFNRCEVSRNHAIDPEISLVVYSLKVCTRTKIPNKMKFSTPVIALSCFLLVHHL